MLSNNFQSPTSPTSDTPGSLANTSMFLVASFVPPIVISLTVNLSSTDVSLNTLNLPLISVSCMLDSTVILSLTIISSNVGRKFVVSPTIDKVGVSRFASSPVTELILVLPMNRSPLLLRPESVSYTHLTLPTTVIV